MNKRYSQIILNNLDTMVTVEAFMTKENNSTREKYIFYIIFDKTYYISYL